MEKILDNGIEYFLESNLNVATASAVPMPSYSFRTKDKLLKGLDARRLAAAWHSNFFVLYRKCFEINAERQASSLHRNRGLQGQRKTESMRLGAPL